MHPPFGFALFYLRSVAPAKAYVDRVSKTLTEGVTTAQIYWGAIPFVVIQVMMVAVVIAFPQIVTGNISEAPGAIKGSGAEELRRQIEGAPKGGVDKGAQSAPKSEDAGAELERLLQGGK
jgi:GntP family gluconate:H+ symporter